MGLVLYLGGAFSKTVVCDAKIGKVASTFSRSPPPCRSQIKVPSLDCVVEQ